MAQTPFPGTERTVTMLPDFPGLHEQWTEARPYFERAYGADGTDDVIRIRFQPVVIDPNMAANIPLAPTHLSVIASASLVDAEGAVILTNGRGLVRPSQSFAQSVADGGQFDPDAFIDRIARILTEDLLDFKRQMDAASLLIPPPIAPPPPPAPETTAPEAADEGVPDIITGALPPRGENEDMTNA